MEEVSNLSREEALDLISTFPIDPIGNRIIITLNVDEDEDEMGLTGSFVSPKQTVMAVGPYVRQILAGDEINIDLDKFKIRTLSNTDSDERVTSLDFRTILVDDRVYCLTTDSTVEYIYKQK